MDIYKIINNRGVALVILMISLISMLGLIAFAPFTNIPIIVEALCATGVIMGIVMVCCSASGHISHGQVIEMLEEMATVPSNTSAIAKALLNQYSDYLKRIDMLSSIEYLDYYNNSLIKNIIVETNTFIQVRMRKGYGILLVYKNKPEKATMDDDRIKRVADAINEMITKLDDIALEIIRCGDTNDKYKHMERYLHSTLDSLIKINNTYDN